MFKKSFLLNLINNKFVQSINIYTMSNLLNALIPFLLLPILTRVLTTEDYGIISMYSVLMSFLTPFIGLSVHGAVKRAYFDDKITDFSEYVSNAIYVFLSSFILVSFVVLSTSPIISRLTQIPNGQIWIVLVFTFSQMLSFMILTIWQVDFKTIKYSIYQNLKTLLNATLSIILVFTLYKSWLGRIYGQLITYSIFIIVAITILHRKKYLFKQFNRDYLRDILLFGLPLIPHTLGTVLISFTDRFLITNLIGISTTGEYNVGYQVGQIINLLALSFNQAFVPWLFSQLSKKNEISRKKIVKLTYLYFIVILLLAIVLSLISPWFLAFFVGKEFNKSYIYVSWVAIGYAFQGMYLMVTNYIFFAKKNKVLAYVTFVTASLNVILTYVFIKLYGVIGAAISTSIVYFTQFLFTWYLSAKVFNMPWNIFKKLN